MPGVWFFSTIKEVNPRSSKNSIICLWKYFGGKFDLFVICISRGPPGLNEQYGNHAGMKSP